MGSGNQNAAFVIIAALIPGLFALPARAQTVEEKLVQSYRAVYNRKFEEAVKRAEEAKRLAPEDPLSLVAQANAVLFQQFDRLQILRSETFASDENFTSRQHYAWNSVNRKSFEAALAGAEQLAQTRLSRDNNDSRALLALALTNSMRGEDAALFDKKNVAALSFFKRSTDYAERLLVLSPESYDAYLATGLGKYVIGCNSAPVRWVLRAGGYKGDREQGVRELTLAAEHARYTAPFAQLLLAFDDLRHNNKAEARRRFAALHDEFPNNPLFLQETAKLEHPAVEPGQ